ncbi:hypothetical protein AAG570_004246 [Ranatra chinensis]|uniref:t-SNARE coiled-coil homology domain-containing protein n=1 Tax=Ranatra chinensis TaxID=642074 RepID=A0ABD0YFT1_9HEMI
MSRDRTAEFGAAVRSLRGRSHNQQVSAQLQNRGGAASEHIKQYTQFMGYARTVGKNLGATYAKLEKLTLLAKKMPLFNDQPTEIQELTYIIGEDLNSLNSEIARLQEVVRQQRHERQLKQQQQQRHQHSSSVLIALQSKLASMSSQFKQVLELRTQNLKEAKRRRENFSQGPPPPMSAGSSNGGGHMGSLLMAAAQDHNLTTMRGGDSGGRQQRRDVTIDLDGEMEEYLTARAETMQNIESTIVELGGIFQQLAHMVKEQEEMVGRIDANVQDTELNVEAAHSEILKYFQSVTSNRWLMVKIFAVLIFFFMFFLVFLA